MIYIYTHTHCLGLKEYAFNLLVMDVCTPDITVRLDGWRTIGKKKKKKFRLLM